MGEPELDQADFVVCAHVRKPEVFARSATACSVSHLCTAVTLLLQLFLEAPRRIGHELLYRLSGLYARLLGSVLLLKIN